MFFFKLAHIYIYISTFHYPLNELFFGDLRAMNFDPKTVKNPHRGSEEVRWEAAREISHPTEGVRFSCGHRVQWAQEALCVEPHRCGFRKLFYINYDRLIKDSVYRGSFQVLYLYNYIFFCVFNLKLISHSSGPSSMFGLLIDWLAKLQSRAP